NDSFGRTGGEEFLALLPGAACAEARELAGLLREVLERQSFDAIVPGLRLTVSIGVAEAGAGESSQALLARADAALYRAKHGGRNRVELASAPGAANARGGSDS
ncbi:diguanylate cyclase, partial [uncultured Xanthomonas sp.]